MILSDAFLRSALIIIQRCLKARHSGMDLRQAILPAALRVNANLFQTDLCRNPGYMDVQRLPSLALDTRFPAGMTDYLNIVCNDKRRVGERNKTQFVKNGDNHELKSCT